LHPLLFQLGSVAIPTYGALNALALVAALALAIYCARRLALNAEKVWNLSLIAILVTLIAARLLLIATHWSAFRQHPFWVLGLASRIGSQTGAAAVQAAAAVLIGALAALLYALAEGLPLLRTLDALSPPAAIALSIHALGAFVAGVDYGQPSRWGAVYTSRLSALWYGTPLGVRLFPVQLIASVAALLLFLLLLRWMPRRAQEGELAGAWLALTGFAGFFLTMSRAHPVFGAADFAVAVAAVLAGGALWLDRGQRRASTAAP
jgi:phosphatidylglycerol:prolipoprotein diacylglycerol transferase